MAWSFEVTARLPIGDAWLVCGVWDATSVTGGDIDSGFTQTLSVVLGHTGSSVEAAVGVVNETIAKATPGPGSATIVCSADDAGTFIMICR